MPGHPEVSSRNPVLTARATEIEIPPEILGKIFLENELPHYPEHKGSLYPPMAVSKSWRNAALSHPQLWIRINIMEYSDLYQSSPDTLQNWLSRSKPCLLDVWMDLCLCEVGRLDGRLTAKDAQQFEPIMKVLFAQTYRWGSLEVLADVWQYSYIFQVLDRASRLRHLCLKDFQSPGNGAVMTTVYQSWGTTGVPKVLLSSVTRLSLSLDVLSFWDFPSLELPALTELAFDNFAIELEDLVKMMKGMPKLAVLTLDRESRVLCERMPLNTPKVLTGLETLVVGNCGADYSFFPQLAEHCQNLRNVTLHYRNLRNLPSSETASLTEVTLILEHDNDDGTVPFSFTRAREFMVFCPNARKLTLTWQSVYPMAAISFDRVIEALASQRQAQQGAVLKLEHLALRNAVLSMSTVLKMLTARSGGQFRASRNDRPFYLTLDGCYGLPNIKNGSFDEVKRLFADPLEINMPFGTSSNPYKICPYAFFMA